MIPDWQASGFAVKLFFQRLASPELAIARVRTGGHDVPEPTIRRRFLAGLRNFETIYKPIVTEWILYDISAASPRFLAEGVNQ